MNAGSPHSRQGKHLTNRTTYLKFMIEQFSRAQTLAVLGLVVVATLLGYYVRDQKADYEYEVEHANASFEVVPVKDGQIFGEPGFYNFRGERVSNYTHNLIGMKDVHTVFYFIPPKTRVALELVQGYTPVGYTLSPMGVGILEDSPYTYRIEIISDIPAPLSFKIVARGDNSEYTATIIADNGDFYGYR